MGFTPSHWLLSVSAECWGRNWRYGEIQFNLLLRLLAPPCKWNKWVTLWTTPHWIVILMLDCGHLVLKYCAILSKMPLFSVWKMKENCPGSYLSCVLFYMLSYWDEEKSKAARASRAHTFQVFRMEAINRLHAGPLLPKEERPGAFVLGFLFQPCWPSPHGSIASFTPATLVDRNKLSGCYICHFPY